MHEKYHHYSSLAHCATGGDLMKRGKGDTICGYRPLIRLVLNHTYHLYIYVIYTVMYDNSLDLHNHYHLKNNGYDLVTCAFHLDSCVSICLLACMDVCLGEHV